MGLAEIKFNKNGGPIIAEITCGYAQAGSYTLFLWEANENKIVMERHGNFINSDNDAYELPIPNNENNGRIVEFIVTVAMTPGTQDYNVELICCQDNQELGRITVSGKSNLPTVTLDLFASLREG